MWLLISSLHQQPTALMKMATSEDKWLIKSHHLDAVGVPTSIVTNIIAVFFKKAHLYLDAFFSLPFLLPLLFSQPRRPNELCRGWSSRLVENYLDLCLCWTGIVASFPMAAGLLLGLYGSLATWQEKWAYATCAIFLPPPGRRCMIYL